MRRGAKLAVPLLYALLAALFLWRPLLSGGVLLPTDLAFEYDLLWRPAAAGRGPTQNPLLADVSDYYYPYRVHAVRELAAGRLPLWNPYILAGTPFFASGQAALLDPVNLLTLPAGPLHSWAWGAWLRLALLGALTHGLARALGRSHVAALGAGSVFMLCGFVVVWLNYPLVTSLVFMPALFWAGLRLVQHGGARRVALTALAVGGLLVGGHPETQFLVGGAWALFALQELAGLRREGSTRGARRAAALAAAVALGLALAAVQWVPFVDFLFRSSAFVERAQPDLIFDPLETAFLLALLLLPKLGGSPAEGSYWLPLNFNEHTGYIGLLALALAALGIVAARRRGGSDGRRTTFLAGVALVAVLLAVRAPGFHLVWRLPLLEVGFGVRWLLVASFCGALLAARGLDAVCDTRPGPPRLGRAALALGAAAALGLAGLGVAWAAIARGPERPLVLRGAAGVSLSDRTLVARALDPRRLAVHPPLLVLLAGSALLLGVARGRLSGGRAAPALCALLYLDLWLFGSRYNPVTPAEAVFPPTQLLSELRSRVGGQRFAAGGDLLRPNVAMVFGLRDLRGYEDVLEPDFAALYGPTLRRLGALEWTRDPSLGRDDVRRLELACVRVLLSARPLRTPFLIPYRLELAGPDLFLYENPDALPRAFTVLAARVVPDASSAREAVLDPGFDPRREVILAGVGTRLESPGEGAPVIWVADEPGQLAFEVELPAPGYLVVSEVHSGGWEAAVDQTATPVLPANGAFQAVAVPPGRHRVELRYRPRVVFTSGVVSAGAGALVLALLLAPRRSLPSPGG